MSGSGRDNGKPEISCYHLKRPALLSTSVSLPCDTTVFILIFYRETTNWNLEIKSKMTIVAPFTNKTVEVINNVNVAETVLIGNVPDTFYNLEGLTDFTTDDSMNLID